MAAHLVPALDAFARFHPEMSSEEAEGYFPLPDPGRTAVALVIDGDVRRDGNAIISTIDLVRDVTPAVGEGVVPVAIFVTGDIVAPDAVLKEYDADWSPLLKIRGSVRVKTLLLYGSTSEIDGDLTAETVFGFYNHGSLRVRGDLRADVLLDSDYSWEVDGRVECRLILGAFDRANFRPTHAVEELRTILVWDAVADDDISYEFVSEALSRGEPILRPVHLIGTAPTPEIGAAARRRLAPLLAQAGEVEEVDLSSCRLRFVPAELLGFAKLKRLSLRDNEIGELPGAMSSLAELEALDLRDCELTRVPPALAGLGMLRDLDLAGNAIADGAEQLERLDALEVLAIGSSNSWIDGFEDVSRFTASLDLAAFPRLRVANFHFGDEVEHRLSSRLWAAPELENLTLSFEAPITLPDALSRATALRVLTVSLDGANAAQSASVLARMPKLELLNLHIFSALDRDQFEAICDAVPDAYVRHWSAFAPSSEHEQALVDNARLPISAGARTNALIAVDTLLQTMPIRRCYERCELLENLLRVKAEAWLDAALAADGDRGRAAAWGDLLQAQIPDLGEHLWRYPVTELGYVRAIGSLCAVLNRSEHASAALAAIRAKIAAESGPAPASVKRDISGWLERTRSAIA